MKQNVFVYGTLKQGHSNHGLMGRAKFIGAGSTVSGAFKMMNGGFPMTFAGGLFKIRGELFEVSDQATLDNLDRLEGVPSFFNRYPVQIETGDGDVHDAFMYVTNSKYENGSHREYIAPNENNECEWN